jgi:hypothetical protein
MSSIQKPACGGRTEYQAALSETPEPLCNRPHTKRTQAFCQHKLFAKKKLTHARALLTGGGGFPDECCDTHTVIVTVMTAHDMTQHMATTGTRAANAFARIVFISEVSQEYIPQNIRGPTNKF